jgi:ketosteroid isomerase-like protein
MKTHGEEEFDAVARRQAQLYADAILRSDADGCMALWDDEATQMPPDSPMVCGKASIDAGFRSAFQRVCYDRFDIDLKESASSGDYGFALGNYTYTVRQKAGGAGVTREGKFLTIYKRQREGSWRIYVDCFNLNARPT